MKRTIYAVEITLTKIDCHTDKYGARLPGSPERQTALRSHYDGSHAKAKARAIYDRIDAVLKEMSIPAETR